MKQSIVHVQSHLKTLILIMICLVLFVFTVLLDTTSNHLSLAKLLSSFQKIVKLNPGKTTDTLPTSELATQPQTISYALKKDVVVLKFGRELYESQVNKNANPLAFSHHSELLGKGLIWKNLEIPNQELTMNSEISILSFQQFPQSSEFLLVVELKTGSSYIVQVLLVDGNSGQITVLYRIDLSDEREYLFFDHPVIDDISRDRRYVSLLVYCWGCEGQQPETVLIDMTTKKVKKIGYVSAFSWMMNGDYVYKDYIRTECPYKVYGPTNCFEDPAKLPEKVGKME